jgi:NADP-dependent 3-hydroxy acid dehydrogenase YdfG
MRLIPCLIWKQIDILVNNAGLAVGLNQFRMA